MISSPSEGYINMLTESSKRKDKRIKELEEEVKCLKEFIEEHLQEDYHTFTEMMERYDSN